MKKMALTQRRDEKIVEAVIVIVADGDTETEHWNSKPSLVGHIRKSAVVIVVVKLQCGGSAMRMTGPVVAIHEEDVGISVVVVIDEGTSGTHGFRQPLFAE